MAWTKNTDPEKIKEYNKQYYLKKVKAKREALKTIKPKTVKEIEKVCPICNKTFTTTNSRKKYCSDECKMQYILKQQKEHRQTKEYKEKIKEYYKSESYKNSQLKYSQSEKGKETKKKYYEKKKQDNLELLS